MFKKCSILYILFLSLLIGCEQQPNIISFDCPNECVTSSTGIALVKQFEGFVPYVYDDAAGLPTIGYGHLIREGESYDYITPDQAEELLKQDLKEAECAVKNLVNVPITQGQFDALVSFTYNLGYGNLRDSTLLKKLNNGEDASAEFEKWVYAGGRKLTGLVLRRKAEALLFG